LRLSSHYSVRREQALCGSSVQVLSGELGVFHLRRFHLGSPVQATV
jgi:hypothetical protein